jgi:hypothetical protein
MHRVDVIRMIADLLVQNAPITMKPQFFGDLIDELTLRGFNLEIMLGAGTHIKLVQRPQV